MIKEKEIEEDMNEMIEKKIRRAYISAGTFIRFKNKCIEYGQLAERERCLKEEIEFLKRLTISQFRAGSSAYEMVINRIEELTQKIKNDGDGK